MDFGAQSNLLKALMPNETTDENLFVQHEKRSARQMKIVVAMFASVLLLILLVIMIA
jgi:hypothetical protein